MDLEQIYHNYYACLSPSEIGTVDRHNNRLVGYVIAQEGEFKSKGRGRFDKQSLEEILKLGKSTPKGLKSRFGHPTESDDGVGKVLGRATDFFMSTTKEEQRQCVRGNLNFNPASFKSPSGNLADYVMTVCETDPDSISSSLVLRAKKIYELGSDGNPTETPPLWLPTELHASDIVNTGDAVDGVLSLDSLPNGYLFKAVQILDLLFPEDSREHIQARLNEFTRKYLDNRFGVKPDYSEYRKRLEEFKSKLKS